MIDIDNYKDKGRHRGVVKREKQGDTKGKKGGKKAERERRGGRSKKGSEEEGRKGRQREKRREKTITHALNMHIERGKESGRQTKGNRQKERERIVHTEMLPALR